MVRIVLAGSMVRDSARRIGDTTADLDQLLTSCDQGHRSAKTVKCLPSTDTCRFGTSTFMRAGADTWPLCVFGMLSVDVGRHGTGNYDFSLVVNFG